MAVSNEDVEKKRQRRRLEDVLITAMRQGHGLRDFDLNKGLTFRTLNFFVTCIPRPEDPLDADAPRLYLQASRQGPTKSQQAEEFWRTLDEYYLRTGLYNGANIDTGSTSIPDEPEINWAQTEGV